MPTALEIVRTALDQHRAGRSEDAKAMLQRVLRREPANAEANHLYGMILFTTGAPVQGEFFVRRAAETDPRRAQFQSNLGNIVRAQGRDAEAASCYRRAVELAPDYAPGWSGLSAALQGTGDYDAAAGAARTAVSLNPLGAVGWTNLAGALLAGGQADPGAAALRHGLESLPDSVELLSALAAALNFIPGAEPQEVLEIHRRCGRAVAAAAGPPLTPDRVRDPDRPLRIGILSPDLRTHSVACFIDPILRGTDQESVVCYSTCPIADQTTQRLRGLAAGWVDGSALSDADLAKRINTDRIDVLLDLAGHTVGARPGILARRPAPVIVTCIGYPNSSGIPGVTARLVDSITDPPDSSVAAEMLVRLDPCFLCYRAPDDAPKVPARAPRPVTFGSFNALPKVNEGVMRLWSRVMAAVPGSRLLLKSRGLESTPVAARCRTALAGHGIDPARVELMGQTAGLPEHLALYDRVDVALDTFPYNGTTTTCEALWMDVPVVTLAGTVHAGRVGASLLNAAGMPELIAATQDEYAAIAAARATAPARPALRERLRASALMDERAYSARFFGALRGIWRQWCAGRPR